MTKTSKDLPKELKSFYENKYLSGEEFPRSSKLFTLAQVPRDRSLDVLDVGCGSGLNSAFLSKLGHRVVGIDVAEAAIEKYCAKGFDGRVMDLRKKMEFTDHSFDLIFASEVIEHIDFPSFTLSEFRRILRPGGILILSTPNSAFWVYRMFGCMGYTISELQHSEHLRFFSTRSLRKLLAEEGFEVQSVTGRNMYFLLGDGIGRTFAFLLQRLGFDKEHRFRTGKDFWHFSRHSSRGISFWADTLIVRAVRKN